MSKDKLDQVEAEEQAIAEAIEQAEGMIAEATKTHTLLEVWNEMLKSIEVVEAQPIGMQYALRVAANNMQMTIQDVPEYVKLYHACSKELRDILGAEIASDPDCFKRVEEDGVLNRHHYLNLLIGWQRQIVLWERAWNPADANAHIKVAAYSDVHSFFLGKTGLVSHLDQIGFEYTSDDAEAVMQAVVAE